MGKYVGWAVRLVAIEALAILLLPNAAARAIDPPKKPAPMSQIAREAWHAAARQMAPTLRMGSVSLQKCPNAPAYCGSLPRALDATGGVSGTIDIGFEVFPHSDRSLPPLEPIVAQEGGPGYPSTGSATSYYALFLPLLDRRDLVLVDERGTGIAQPIECQLLQMEPNPQFPGITACGALLGNTSDLYGTGQGADDMAAVLDALGVSVINLYGDSYGTFFSQAFAERHPEHLRSLILDSAYPVIGESP